MAPCMPGLASLVLIAAVTDRDKVALVVFGVRYLSRAKVAASCDSDALEGFQGGVRPSPFHLGITCTRKRKTSWQRPGSTGSG
jgi:hypothetical protein